MSKDNMTTVEIVNVFCDMQGLEMSQAQRDALASIFQTIYESGANKALEPVNEGPPYEGPAQACDGCKTVDYEGLDLQLGDIAMLNGKGTYCKFCRQTVAAKLAEDINLDDLKENHEES